jgi:hypothetical protein
MHTGCLVTTLVIDDLESEATQPQPECQRQHASSIAFNLLATVLMSTLLLRMS